MKVFFTASYRGKKQFGKYYEIISNEIKALGYNLIPDDLLTTETKEFYRKFGNQAKQVQYYREELERLQVAEINVFECSFHSLSIGFTIEKSLEFNKPTILLYHEHYEPLFLTGVNEEKLFIKKYNDKTLKVEIKKSLDEAKTMRDKRFNFFISPKLLAYLEETSKQMGVTKSRFIRDLILQHKKGSGSKKH